MKKSLLATFAAAVLVASPALKAAPSFYLQGKGFAKLDINALAQAVAALGLQATVVGGTTETSPGVFKLPVAGGGIDANGDIFEAVCTGGFTLSNGTDTVTFNSPIFNTTGSQAILTMLVTIDGSLQGRYTVANVQLTAPTVSVAAGTKVKAKGLALTLSAFSAEALNEVYNTAAFMSGQSVGTAVVKMFAGEGLP